MIVRKYKPGWVGHIPTTWPRPGVPFYGLPGRAMKSNHFHQEYTSPGWVGHIPTTWPRPGVPFYGLPGRAMQSNHFHQEYTSPGWVGPIPTTWPVFETLRKAALVFTSSRGCEVGRMQYWTFLKIRAVIGVF